MTLCESIEKSASGAPASATANSSRRPLFSQAGGTLYVSVRNNLTCATIPPHGFNVTRYCNPALDALNDRYETSFDPSVRKQIAAEMQRILDRDVPGIVTINGASCRRPICGRRAFTPTRSAIGAIPSSSTSKRSSIFGIGA